MNTVLDFFETYKIVKQINNNYLIHNQKTREYLLYKQIHIQNPIQIINQLEKHRAFSHQHLLHLINYSILHQSLKILYQITSLSLKQYLHSKILINHTFKQPQLWAILHGVIMPLAYLQKNHIGYYTINLDIIFITDDHKIKIMDPSICSNPLILNKKQYYSPEMLNLLIKKQLKQINVFKSDVFVLALCILNCGLLKQINQNIIDYNTGQVNFDSLEDLVCQMGKQYSYQLMTFIVDMLDQNVETRPDFLQLQKKLKKMHLQQQEILQIVDKVYNIPMECDIQDEGNGISDKFDENEEFNDGDREQKEIEQLFKRSYMFKSGKTNVGYKSRIENSTNYREKGIQESIGVKSYLWEQDQLQKYLPAGQNLYTSVQLMRIIRQDLQRINKNRQRRENNKQNLNGVNILF